MIAAGMDATIAADNSLSGTIEEALAWAEKEQGAIIICGSLFLVGAALAHFNAFPWQVDNERERDPAEQLKK
jgi:folylpolyglutamate synthase/dihydropteroate synthase